VIQATVRRARNKTSAALRPAAPPPTTRTLRAGEVDEFGMRLPHWFGHSGGHFGEALSLFGRQGESVHVRAKSEPRETGRASRSTA
jgi:hypothetical protein